MGILLSTNIQQCVLVFVSPEDYASVYAVLQRQLPLTKLECEIGKLKMSRSDTLKTLLLHGESLPDLAELQRFHLDVLSLTFTQSNVDVHTLNTLRVLSLCLTGPYTCGELSNTFLRSLSLHNTQSKIMFSLPQHLIELSVTNASFNVSYLPRTLKRLYLERCRMYGVELTPNLDLEHVELSLIRCRNLGDFLSRIGTPMVCNLYRTNFRLHKLQLPPNLSHVSLHCTRFYPEMFVCANLTHVDLTMDLNQAVMTALCRQPLVTLTLRFYQCEPIEDVSFPSLCELEMRCLGELTSVDCILCHMHMPILKCVRLVNVYTTKDISCYNTDITFESRLAEMSKLSADLIVEEQDEIRTNSYRPPPNSVQTANTPRDLEGVKRRCFVS